MLNRTKIEWCTRTWNPVTGCLHGCQYCYARKISERFNGSAGFIPHFHAERINDPSNEKKPQRIFVVSMGDLFGCWISDLIIELVFAEIQRAKHHKYLFLTKNPARYLELPGTYFSKNLWFGTTVTGFQDCHRIKSLQDLPEYVNKFVSFEPLLNDCGTPDLNGIGWVIIGAQTNPFYPVMWKWLNGICYAAGNTPVFFKNNLKDWMTGSMMFRQDYPTELTR